MALDLATLGIRIENGQIVATTSALDKLTGAGAKAESTFDRLKGAAAGLGVALGAGAIFTKFVRETIESQNQMAQLEARVKSTGAAAGFTVKQLDDLSSAIERQTVFSDEAVKGAESLLLTFTKIKAGELPGATMAVANLATALGTDLKSASIQVGKALQDPTVGLLALRRSGVSFSEAQQEVIKSLFATGREAEAQRMILKELEVEFGGAAAAARDTLGGALQGLQNAIGNVFEVSRGSMSGLVSTINAVARNAEITTGAMVGLAGAIAAVSVAAAAPAMGAFLLTLANPATLVSIAAIATLGVIFGTAATNAALAERDTREYLATLNAMSKVQLDAKLHAINEQMEHGMVTTAEYIKLQKMREDTIAALAGKHDLLKKKTDEVTESAYAMALADARAAKAKKELTDEIDRQLAREDRLRDMNKGYIKPEVGGFAPQPTMPTYQGSGPITNTGPAGLNTSTGAYTAGWLEAINRVVAAEAEAAKLRAQIVQNMLLGMQQGLSTFFQDVFTKGMKSFGDLWNSVKAGFLRMASELLASNVMGKLAAAFAVSAAPAAAGAAGTAAAGSGGGSFLGGLGGAVMAHPYIAAVAAIGIGVAALWNHSKKAKEAAEQMRKAQAAFAETLDGYVKNAAGTTTDLDRSLAQAKKNYEDIQNQISGIFSGRKNETARFAARRVADDAYAAEIERLKDQAAAADAAAAASRALADAMEKQAQQAAYDDLRVRALAANGDQTGADAMRFQLNQEAERQKALDDHRSQAYLDLLAQVLAAEAERYKADHPAPGSTVTGSTVTGPSAGVIVASQMSASVTSYQGDRLVDELAAARIIQRTYLPFLKSIDGRLDAFLSKFGITVDAALGSQMGTRSLATGNAMMS